MSKIVSVYKIEADQLRAQLIAASAENVLMRRALEEIAIPSGIETDGSGSAEEYEELYDFWHMKSADKLNLASDALSKPPSELTSALEELINGGNDLMPCKDEVVTVQLGAAITRIKWALARVDAALGGK